MFLDMDGNLKEIPKTKRRRKGKKLSKEKFLDNVQKLMRANTDGYCLFYSKNGIVYRVTNCSKEHINDFIMYNRQLDLENTIYKCIDSYFYQEEYEDEKTLLDEILNELNEEQNNNQDD